MQIDSAVSKTLAEILKNIDFCPNPDDVEDPYMCRAVREDGSRCQNMSCNESDGWQMGNLWPRFEQITECPEPDEFYDQIETAVALTHCENQHRDRALNAFTAWKAKRQAALNSPPFPSSANEVSNSQQDVNFPEILYDGTKVKSLDSILAKHKKPQKIGVLRCPGCDRSFSRPGSMRRHMAEAHGGSREFLCSNSGCKKSMKGNGFKKCEQLILHEDICMHRTRSLSPFEQAIAFQEEVGKSPTDESAGKSLDMAQEVQTSTIAPPATDSGYGSTSATESKLGMSMRHTNAEQPTQEILDQDMNDTATEYSYESTSTFSKKQCFVRELANELFKGVSSFNANETIRARVSNILPELLQALLKQIGKT